VDHRNITPALLSTVMLTHVWANKESLV
jgi:hypothetical protein